MSGAVVVHRVEPCENVRTYPDFCLECIEEQIAEDVSEPPKLEYMKEGK